MIYISIITSDKVKNPAVLSAESQYLERMSSIMRVEFKVCSRRGGDSELAAYKGRTAEGSLIFALDERGKQMTSPHFSGLLTRSVDGGNRKIAFWIGPAAGFSPETVAAADVVFSLSLLTFPFQLCRLLLVEQLYRALTIMKGHPYHKE